MSKMHFTPENEAVLNSFLLSIPEVKAGKMFGNPAYYIKGKMFACLFEEGVILKVPEEYAKSLVAQGEAIPFEPRGVRKMREWVQVNRANPQEYLSDQELFLCAIDFVTKIASEQLKSSAKRHKSTSKHT